MTKKIFEELPARKHAPAAAPVAAKGKEGGEKKGGQGEGSEKRIRQAVYDIRYRARREGIDLRAAYAQYMQNSNLSAPEQAAVRAKLFGKDGGGEKKEVKESKRAPIDYSSKEAFYASRRNRSDELKAKGEANKEILKAHGESYTPVMTDGATNVVASAMFKVFVEGRQKEVVYEQEGGDRKYKVRVTDPKNDRSYVRYATREKITQLRQKGLKVEMTEHGEPYEGRKKEVPNNKSGLDKPVHPSRRDGDVNDDNVKDKTDSYIYNRRDAINAAIAKKKAMREDFIISENGTTSTEGQNKGKITGNNVDNYSTGVVTINPENSADQGKNGRMRRGLYAHTEVEGELIAEKAVSKSQQKFMAMVCQVKKGKMEAPSAEVAKAAKEMSEKDACDYAETKHDKLPEKVSEEAACPKCGKCPCECENKDNRAAKTYRDLLKNKLRAMGVKNPIMLGAPEDPEEIMKVMTSSSAKMTAESSCGGSHTPKKKKKKKGY